MGEQYHRERYAGYIEYHTLFEAVKVGVGEKIEIKVKEKRETRAGENPASYFEGGIIL